MAIRLPRKDPDEILDYFIDFTPEFERTSNDRLIAITVAVQTITSPPLTLVQAGTADSVAYFWLSGGVAGVDYDIDVTLDTQLGRRFNDTYKIQVFNR